MSWGVGESFKIEVYVDDGASNQLAGTLYIKQDTAEDTVIEMVEVSMNLGVTRLPESYQTIVTRQ